MQAGIETRSVVEAEHGRIVQQVEQQITDQYVDHIQMQQAQAAAQFHMLQGQAEQYARGVQEEAKSAVGSQRQLLIEQAEQKHAEKMNKQ